MNPQFAQQQQQQFGAPPNRASPSMGPPPMGANFQNIPLGPQKTMNQLPPTTQLPPTSSPLNPISGPPPQLSNLNALNQLNFRPQIPPGQLPPGGPLSDQKPANQFGPPPTSKPTDLTQQFQNGPAQFQNGPPGIQNGPGFGSAPPETSAAGPNILAQPKQPSQMAGQSQPPLANQNPPFHPPQRTGLPGQIQPQLPGQSTPNNQPPLHQPQPPIKQTNLPGPPQSQSSQSPLPKPSISQTSLPQQPPTSQPLHPSMPPPLSSQPPLLAGQQHPPSVAGQPNYSMPPPSNFTSPSSQMPMPGQPPSQLPHQQPFHSTLPPLPQTQQHPQNPHLGGGPPAPINSMSQFGPPQTLPGGPALPGQIYKPPGAQQPQSMGMPPGPNRIPPPGAPPNQFNQPPIPGQIPPPNPGSNFLPNQMQGMNLGGVGRYPATKNSINGDGGPPHMPPPLNQQYMNGQQVRGPPAPGYPPMPGQPMAAHGGGYPQPSYPEQPQQPKRLDPDQMPSPIQVTQEDQYNRSGIFCTNQKGLVPPLVTTNFIVQDQGNSSPRFVRSTMYNVPISHDIMKQTAVPFSLIISPMARPVEGEYPPPIVDFGELGPVRCIRCKAYMCPFMQFIDSGRRFQCLFCKATTDVPAEYFQHLDHTGQRLDRYERPELVLGTYEFLATTDYCRDKTLPKPPAIIFVIDVSYNNIKSGLVHLLCSQMKEIIQNLPMDQGQEKSNMKVGFITYNSSVHFYNIKGSLAAPQMLVVGDTQEMFMPLLDGFLCTPEESAHVIDDLMQQIPEMFGDTRETETILLPAILAGLEALKASDCAGKLLVFHSTLPTAEAPGKLKNRDDRKLLGTDKEKTILTPQTQAYNQLGQDCVGAGCSVDLFIFNNAYIDIATIGQVSRLSGGEVYKYTYFQADIDGERLIRDIITDISRPIAFDAIMRVRTSTGVRPTDFYGHFFMSNTTDMELAAIDCDKAVAVEIKHDDKLSEEEGVYIQAALLYTSCSGQRRLRIINLSLKTCSQMGDLYRSCDCDSIINYLSKQATFKLLDNNPKAVKDSIVSRGAQVLATYRKHCASPSSAGQLILPECMKLLPLYVNCLLKSDALSGGSEMTIDDRSFVMQEVMIMDVPTSVNYFYPRLIPLHDLDLDKEPIQVPAPIRCTVDKMNEQGVYILENGIHMFLWIGLGASPDFIQNVFGVPSAIQVEIDRVSLPNLETPLSKAIRGIIDEIRVQRHRCMRLTIVRQREKLEPVFKHFLAEDRGTDGSPSYVDFLIHMHKEIRTLLS